MGINQVENTYENNLILEKEKRYKLRKRELTLQKLLQDLNSKIYNMDLET